MDKRFWGIILVICLVFVGIVVFSKDNNPTNNVKPTNHVVGTDKNSVTLVEYGDFQCPACGKYYPTVHQIVEEYKDRIQFQFRNLPLSQIHQNAFSAARAAEAADKQSKYWEMYDMLYQNQSVWAESDNPKNNYVEYAKQLGLDIDKFNSDYASKAVNDIINADLDAFAKTKETKQTPTFFLNGKKINPDASVESFKKVIDEALGDKAKDSGSTTPDSSGDEQDSTI